MSKKIISYVIILFALSSYIKPAFCDTVVYLSGVVLDNCEVIDTTDCNVNIKIFNNHGESIISVPLNQIHRIKKSQVNKEELTKQSYDNSTTTDIKKTFENNRFTLIEGLGFGVHSIYPATGISVKVQADEYLSIQGILGFFGDLKCYSGKFNLNLKDETYWRTYGYGIAGVWSYEGMKIHNLEDIEKKTETVFGFGGGIGIEIGQSFKDKTWSRSIPPLSLNIEIGYGNIIFKEIDYEAQGFIIGGGIHFLINL